MLADTLHAASYASIYVPATGQGAICNQEGYFQLDGISVPECSVEVSYIGYSTHTEVIRFDTARCVAFQVVMQEEPISLANVFVTPDGEDAAVYIFRKVLDRAKENRARLQHFEADVQSSLYAQDLDIIPQLLPKLIAFALKSAMRMSGLGALANLFFQHALVDVDIRYQMDYTKGKLRYLNDALVKSVPQLDKKTAKDCFGFCHYDPLKEPMEQVETALKKSLKTPGTFRLVGTVEEQGHVIDILENSVRQGDTLLLSQKYYVIEDVWSLLRTEYIAFQVSENRVEFRDIGQGIYLPVLRVDLPKACDIDFEAEFDKEMAKDGRQPTSFERGVLQRWKQLAESARSMQPRMNENFSIQYRNVMIDR